MRRGGIGLRVDRDRRDPELAQRAQDADRDLTAVGDEDLPEHDLAVPEARRALLHEGGHALAGVVGAEDLHEQ